MPHPFIDLIALRLDESAHGKSRCSLQVEQKHFNSAGAVHGAVLFALADTGMGKALYSALDDRALVATIEAKISFFKPVTGGLIVCESELINPGTSIASLESTLTVDGTLVARACATFNIKRKAEALG
jgi:acyl-CoA thioesterase